MTSSTTERQTSLLGPSRESSSNAAIPTINIAITDIRERRLAARGSLYIEFHRFGSVVIDKRRAGMWSSTGIAVRYTCMDIH